MSQYIEYLGVSWSTGGGIIFIIGLKVYPFFSFEKVHKQDRKCTVL